jgi:hypothetical protein
MRSCGTNCTSSSTTGGGRNLTPAQRITARDAIFFDRYLRIWRDAGGLLDAAKDRDLSDLLDRGRSLGKKIGLFLRVLGGWLPFRARASVARLLHPSDAVATGLDSARA